jgi:hypothetical protein
MGGKSIKMKVRGMRILFGAAISLFFGWMVLHSQEKVPFPENWEKLNLVEEGEILKGNPLFAIVPGLHRTYLNDVAYEHFKKYVKEYIKEGKEPPPFPEGSLIVFVNFKDKAGKQPRLILVMHKKKEYGQTGGWGWEGFSMPDKKPIVTNVDKDCANCHYKGTKDWDGNFFPHVKVE